MPVRFRNFRRALVAMGAKVTNPGSGSHFHVELNGLTYTIPAHNADNTEIPEVYIRGACRALKINEAELRKHF